MKTHIISFRLTQEEYEALQGRIPKLSTNQIARLLVTHYDKPIYFEDTQHQIAVMAAFNRYANNINQLARAINTAYTNGTIQWPLFASLQQDLKDEKRFWQHQLSILKIKKHDHKDNQ